jgi:hypothetical protein
MDDSEAAKYIEMLRDPDGGVPDEAEEAVESIEIEIRQAFGEIEGYRLAEVSAGGILLVNHFVDSRYIRPSIQLCYDTAANRYRKVLNLIPKDFTKNIREDRAVTDEDRAIVGQALDRIDLINHGLGSRQAE